MRLACPPRVCRALPVTLLTALFLSFSLGSPELRAQSGDQELIKKAEDFIKKNDYVGGRATFEELIKRFSSKPAATAALDNLYFFLARSYYDELKKNPESKSVGATAITKFKEYESKYPEGLNVHYSIMSRVDINLNIGNKKDATEACELLLSPRYNPSIPNNTLRDEAKRLLTRLYFETENWSKGLPWFSQMLGEYAGDKEKRSLVAMYISVAHMKQAIKEGESVSKNNASNDKDKKATNLLSKDQVNRLMEAVTPMLPRVELDSIARNELFLNGVLFNTAEVLYRSQAYVEASYFYYQTQTPGELLNFMNVELEVRRKELATLLNTDINSSRKGELEDRVKEMEAKVKEISEQQTKEDYTPYLRLRKADCLRLLNRHFEGHFAFLEMSVDFKGKEPKNIDSQTLWWVAFELACKAPMTKRAVALGEAYLDGKDWKPMKFEKEVMLKLIDIYELQNNNGKVLVMADRFLRKFPDDRRAKLMIFKIGDSLVKARDYQKLKDQTTGYIELFKDRPDFRIFKDGLLYWRGISQILLQDFEQALPDFSVIVKEYVKDDGKTGSSDYWEDAQFREAICYFGQQMMDEAEPKLKFFIETFPKNTNRGEAHLYLGDLFAGDGRVDEAIANYQLAVEYTVKFKGSQTFIDHATFQAGQLQEKAKRFDDMQKTYEQYIKAFEKVKEADISSAVYNLGRSFEGQNRPDKMVATYYSAITKFGEDKTTVGLDHILRAVNERYEANLAVLKENQDFLKEMLENKAERLKVFSDNPESEKYRFDVYKKYQLLDRGFRSNARKPDFLKKCLESDAFLQDQFTVYDEIRKNLPEKPPVDTFAELYKEAKSKDKRTLALRLLMAADISTGKRLDSFVFTESDLAVASPATLVWISQKTSDKKLATEALNTVLKNFGESDFAFDAYLQLGSQSEKIGDLVKAMQYYESAANNFPSHENAFQAYIRQGDLLVGKGDYAKAKDIYEDILKNPQWKRGSARVETEFKTGMMLKKKGDYKAAAATFTRLFIAYPTNLPWGSMAYLEAGSSWGLAGDAVKEQEVYQKFLQNSVARRNAEVEKEIQQRAKK